MPMDSQGKHRPNSQLAKRADQMSASRMAPKPGSAPGGDKEAMPGMPGGEEKDSIGSVTVHDHGDGTSHTEHEDGSRVDHPHVTHMAAHLMAHHAPGDKHMAMSHDGMSGKDSHADESGTVDGPHEHPDVESMLAHGGSVMEGEGHEVPHEDEEDGYGEDLKYGV